MAGAVDTSPCPACGEPLHATLTTTESGDQLAIERLECPSCGASLTRDIDGHVDRGWRLADDDG
jgi:endogenous inhibitor of DNA gyrase (YacG/DUF329 family)